MTRSFGLVDRWQRLTARRDDRPAPHEEIRELPRSFTSEATRPWRAAVLTGIGGLLTIVVSVGMRRTGVIAFGVGDAGTIVGGLTLMLGLFMLSRPELSWLLGGLAVLAGVVSFPMSLGGLVAGAVLTVLGGALGAAWQPPPDGAVLAIRDASAVRRIGATLVDATLAAATGMLLTMTVLRGAAQAAPWLFWVVMAGLWIAVTLPGVRWRGTTPGKWLVRLQVAPGPQGAEGAGRVVRREVIRFVWVCASVAAVALSVPAGPAMLAVSSLLVLAAWALVLARGWSPHDRVARTSVIHRVAVMAPSGPAPIEH